MSPASLVISDTVILDSGCLSNNSINAFSKAFLVILDKAISLAFFKAKGTYFIWHLYQDSSEALQHLWDWIRTNLSLLSEHIPDLP